jgi:putative intracellular protease/amidase
VLEEALTRKAGQYAKIAPWGVNVIKQDRVITGQNPPSAAAVGQAMVERLNG